MAAMYFFKLAMLSRWVVAFFALFSIVALFCQGSILSGAHAGIAPSGGKT